MVGARAPTGGDVSPVDMICVIEHGDNLNTFRQSRGPPNFCAAGVPRYFIPRFPIDYSTPRTSRLKHRATISRPGWAGGVGEWGAGGGAAPFICRISAKPVKYSLPSLCGIPILSTHWIRRRRMPRINRMAPAIRHRYIT